MTDDHDDVAGNEVSDSEYVRRFIPLVDFLGEVLGKSSEVLLHDVSRPESSVIAIANGEISGRRIGAPATDLVLRLLREGTALDGDYVAGYRAASPTGARVFRSATYYFRRQGRIVAMLCINTDDSLLEQLTSLTAQIAERHLPGTTAGSAVSEWTENLGASAEEIAVTATGRAVEGRGVPLQQFQQHDRLEVVRELEREGIFSLKGAVADVARALETSEPTIYRYLRTVRRG